VGLDRVVTPGNQSPREASHSPRAEPGEVREVPIGIPVSDEEYRRRKERARSPSDDSGVTADGEDDGTDAAPPSD